MRDFRSFDAYLFDTDDKINTTEENKEDEPKKFNKKVYEEDEVDPWQTSKYDRGQMPMAAIELIDLIYPNNKYIDLEVEEEEK